LQIADLGFVSFLTRAGRLANPMKLRALSRAEVREVDQRAIQEYGMSGLVLMENAGRGCADVLFQLGCRGPVAVVCGRGNNAGDGFVIARHLDLRGIEVRALLPGSPGELRGDAAANYAILAKCGVPVCDLSAPFDAAALDAQLAGCEWVVDALLGTGTTGAPRAPFDAAIRRMNAAAAQRLAVDLPSGLDCDKGEPAEPTFRAHHTCTFVAPKMGFANPAAATFLGLVHVLDIGAPRRLIEEIGGAVA
jgi:NAD(P)H-hydrate epimerase